LVLRLGPEINSWACLWVLPRPRHLAQCWLINQRPSRLCIACLETPRTGSGPRYLRPEPPLTSSSAISLPRTPACPGTQYSPTACRVEMSFNALWHCWTTFYGIVIYINTHTYTLLCWAWRWLPGVETCCCNFLKIKLIKLCQSMFYHSIYLFICSF
jgi:hypothetical protein